MMAYPELAESEGAQGVLAALHSQQIFPGHGTAVFDAGRETSRGRFVPYAQTRCAGKLADLIFPQTSVEQRRCHFVPHSSLLAGAEIPAIIHIDTVSDGVKASIFAKLLHRGKELVFAVKTARSVVARVLRPIELIGGNH